MRSLWVSRVSAGCVRAAADRRLFERVLLSAMTAMRQGAAAQLELADAAIAVIVGCSNLANEAALATIGPSEGADPF